MTTQVCLEAGLLSGVPFAWAGPDVSGFAFDFHCQHAVLADVDGGPRLAVHDLPRNESLHLAIFT